MARCLLLFFLILAWVAAGQDQNEREDFLVAYYAADYEKAHSNLKAAFPDTVAQETWDHRIHLHQDISDCDVGAGPTPAARAIARLRIGQIEQAKKEFADDWISCVGLGTIARWTSQPEVARSYARKALSLAPDQPDVQFFAGDVASSGEQTIEHFTRFLALNPGDPFKKNVAQFSIEFLKRTRDMKLNVVVPAKGIDELKTDFNEQGLLAEAHVNGDEKVKLLFDTGAGGLVLEKRDWNPQIETDLVMLGIGKKQMTTGKRLVLDQFQAGRLTVKNPTVALSQSLPSSEIDGITSAILFSNHRVLLPLKSGRNITLLPYDVLPDEYFQQKKWKFSKTQTLPFYMVNKMVILKGRIKESSPDLDIMLDTGSDRSLISVAAAKEHAYINYPLSRMVQRESGLTGIGGRADDVLVAENVEVQIGDMKKSFNRMMALNFAQSSEGLELELDLILGRDFLEDYTLLIDYRDRTVTFLK